MFRVAPLFHIEHFIIHTTTRFITLEKVNINTVNNELKVLYKLMNYIAVSMILVKTTFFRAHMRPLCMTTNIHSMNRRFYDLLIEKIDI